MAKNTILFLTTLFLINFSVVAQVKDSTQSSTHAPKSKKGSELKFTASDSSFSVKFGARIQSLYVGEYDLDSKKFNDEFQIRRARLKFDGFVFHPNLTYKIELALSNSDIGSSKLTSANSNTANIVLDAVAKWKAAKNLSIWFGQTKLPGNRERVISSQKLQFVDRSLLNSRYNIDRDLGVQVHHEFAVGKAIVREIAAVSGGEGRNITVQNAGGHDFTGRVEFLPFGEFQHEGDYSSASLERESTPKLSLGLTYDFNDRASRSGGQLGNFLSQQRDLKTIFADAMFKYKNFSMMAEYANKKSSGSPVVSYNPTGSVNEAFFTGEGFNVQGGWLFKNNFEVAARYTTISPDATIQKPNDQQYTVGLSRYLKGHTVKVQSDVSWLREASANKNLVYRFQLEFGF